MHRAIALSTILLLCSCAGPQSLQPRVNGLMAQNQYDSAIDLLESNKKLYGPKNELLYLLDRGYVLHLSGRYQESIQEFEKAKRIYDELYGHSFSEVVGSMLVNDYWKAYRGEDYEYILLNIFQSLNFAAVGKIEESTADIRLIDNQFKLISARYKDSQKNIYRDDAFARLLGGAYFEALASAQDFNDAYISNVKSLRIYEDSYTKSYGQSTPIILKQNLLTTAQRMDGAAYQQFHAQFPDISLVTAKDKQKKAEVYLIEYTGYSPLKVEDNIVLPVDESHIIRLSFPRLVDRYSQTYSSSLIASSMPGVETVAPTEIVEDITSISKAVIENQKGLVKAEALLRPMARYVVEKATEESLRAHHEDTAAGIVMVLGNLYNLLSERADVRSWQTLPGQIRMARVLLEPGHYVVMVRDYDGSGQLIENKNLGEYDLKAGEKKFLVNRCYK